METEKLRASAPFLLVDVVLILVVVMLLHLDWIIHNTLYNYDLTFSLNWAVPYWMALRIILGALALALVSVTVIGFRALRKAEKEAKKVVFICKSCGNAWTELDRNVRVKERLPKFKILKSCASCDKEILDE